MSLPSLRPADVKLIRVVAKQRGAACLAGTRFARDGANIAGVNDERGSFRGTSPRYYQFFWMTQSPPAALNPLHNFPAFSADAKGPIRARW